ncbi:MAG: prepilin-type N-terminal cleavage/methylation domain-containing protein [Lachnospiraceae bacterium]
MKKKQGGYSLIELIVVISIIAIVSGALFTGINALVRSNRTTCANLIYRGLQETKTDALSKSAAYLTISFDPAKEKYGIQTLGKDIVYTGNSNMKITYIVEDADHNEAILDVTSRNLILSYQKGSGSFLPVIESVNADGSYVYLSDSDGDKLFCKSITITAGGKTSDLTLNKSTGKTVLN